MSHIKTQEVLDEKDQEELIREQALIEWALKYLENRKTKEPPLKKRRLDEQDLLEWSLNYLKKRKEKEIQ